MFDRTQKGRRCFVLHRQRGTFADDQHLKIGKTKFILDPETAVSSVGEDHVT